MSLKIEKLSPFHYLDFVLFFQISYLYFFVSAQKSQQSHSSHQNQNTHPQPRNGHLGQEFSLYTQRSCNPPSQPLPFQQEGTPINQLRSSNFRPGNVSSSQILQTMGFSKQDLRADLKTENGQADPRSTEVTIEADLSNQSFENRNSTA